MVSSGLLVTHRRADAKHQPRAEYQLNWDAGNVSGGVYFYKLRVINNGATVTGKIVKI